MKRFIGAALAVTAAGSLGACHFPGTGGGSKAPTGQVVANVGDQEITLRELKAESPPLNTSDPKIREQSDQATLRNMVGRTILAKAARDQGLDKTPDFDMAKRRVEDTLLVQALQEKIAKGMPAITDDDAQRFIAEHPDIFAQRKVFTIDFIRIQRPTDPGVIKALEPLKTLDQVEEFLKSKQIPYQHSTGNLDAVGADPRMIDAMIKLPPNEVFVIPNGQTLLINKIVGSKVVPFTGPQAVDYAKKVMTRQRTQEAINRQFNEIIAKAKPTVKFNKAYAAAAPNPGAVTAPDPNAPRPAAGAAAPAS